MKSTSYFRILILISFISNVYGLTRDKLPHPTLDSAEIEWWFPTYINPPKLHTTLTTFDIGNIWKNVTDTTPNEIKRKIGKEYKKIKNRLIASQNELLRNQFSNLFKQEIKNNEAYSLNGIDIISTHPDFANSFVLDSTFTNPSGNKSKLLKLKKVFEDHTAFETERIKTRKGLITAPKYRWFLVIKFDNNFRSFRNRFCSNQIFQPYPQSTKYAYLPHITLGRIENVKEFNVFMHVIKLMNVELSKKPMYLSLQLNKINRNISNEVLQLKSQKLSFIDWFEENNDKIYFQLDSHKNNLVSMIVIGWNTLIGKLLQNLIKTLSDIENAAKEELLKSSIISLSQLSRQLTSLMMQKQT